MQQPARLEIKYFISKVCMSVTFTVPMRKIYLHYKYQYVINGTLSAFWIRHNYFIAFVS